MYSKFVDITDTICKQKMFIQYISQNHNFLLGGFGMGLCQSLKVFLLILMLI